jgi:hypothetical protein
MFGTYGFTTRDVMVPARGTIRRGTRVYVVARDERRSTVTITVDGTRTLTVAASYVR